MNQVMDTLKIYLILYGDCHVIGRSPIMKENVHYEEILHSVLAILRICLRISKKNLNARIV